MEIRCRLAEDHLRAQIATIDPAVQHGHAHDQKQKKHEREENDRKLANPQLLPGEVETLTRDVEAHHIEKGKYDKDSETQ